MKKIIFMLMTIILLSSCSIDRIDDIALNTFATEYVGPNVDHPNGGYYVYFYTDGIITNTIFLSNGSNGADGKDGINGIDGINGTNGVSATMSSVLVEPSEQYPFGGYLLTFGVGTNVQTIFISNGSNGTNGINGIDGIDGKDGVSVTIKTEATEGGTILIITQGTETIRVFIKDGTNGTNGLDGLNGTDGTNGLNASIRSEVVEVSETHPYGGYNLYITNGDVTTVVFVSNGVNGIDGQNGTDGLNGLNGTNGVNGVNASIRSEVVEVSETHPYGGYNLYITTSGTTTVVFVSNGADGQNGLDGEDGTDGQDGEDGQDLTNGDGTVTICHKVTHPVTEHPEWGSNTNVTLTLNLSEYIQHIYEYHNGNSTQNDIFGSCENQ